MILKGKLLPKCHNSFELENRVHCFNHTLQLSAKTLLCPFNAGLGKTSEDGDNNNIDDLLNQVWMTRMKARTRMKRGHEDEDLSRCPR
jgi:hypothetical protein